MKTFLILLLLVTPVIASDLPPKTVDYIFEMATDVYQDIPQDDCLVQQMCMTEEGQVKCFEFYIFRDGSLAMMPWGGE